MEILILIAADPSDRSRAVSVMLEEAGYQIAFAHHYSEVVSSIERIAPDILLIDSKLPGMSRFNLVERLTGNGKAVPVMVLGNDGAEEAVQALEAGAHDYIPQEWDPREMLARIANLLRIFQPVQREINEAIQIGDLVIDPLKRSVVRGEEPVELTHREFDLLLFLAKRAGQVCTREDILRYVWDYDFHTGTNVVDVYILHLREKVDKGRKLKLLRTIRGAGYKLMAPDEIDTNAKNRLP